METSKKYITEHENRYLVKIKTFNGMLSKSYAFVKWGGKRNAFNLALVWRNETLKKNSLMERLNFIKSPDNFKYSKTNYPIIGIYQSISNTGVNWCSAIQKDYQIIKKHFSIKKYGNKKAFLKACEVRYINSGTLIIINRDLLPCLPKVPYKICKRHEGF